jgi:hypothetical protein
MKNDDTSFVFAIKDTPALERLHAEVIDALKRRPPRMVDKLVASGVRIALVPTLAEGFAKLNEPVRRRNSLGGYGVYSPVSKTIYIEDSSHDPYGSTSSDDLITGLACAYAYMIGLAESTDYKTSLSEDNENIPEDLRRRFKARHQIDPMEHYARLFSILTLGQEAKPVIAEFRRAFPKTSLLVEKSIADLNL